MWKHLDQQAYRHRHIIALVLAFVFFQSYIYATFIQPANKRLVVKIHLLEDRLAAQREQLSALQGQANNSDSLVSRLKADLYRYEHASPPPFAPPTANLRQYVPPPSLQHSTPLRYGVEQQRSPQDPQQLKYRGAGSVFDSQIPPPLDVVPVDYGYQINREVRAVMDTSVIPILVLCYKRPNYLEKTLAKLFDSLPDDGRYDIFVSQDHDADVSATLLQSATSADERALRQTPQQGGQGGGATWRRPPPPHGSGATYVRPPPVAYHAPSSVDNAAAKHIDTDASVSRAQWDVGAASVSKQKAVAAVVQAFQHRYPGRIEWLLHRRNFSDMTDMDFRRHWHSYYAIAHHYKAAIDSIFARTLQSGVDASAERSKAYARVVVLEEDMELSPDAFQYFRATSWLLDADPSLLCVSAWNDNGKTALVSNATALYRTDFFPGLGWMMSAATWASLSAIWPAGFWDDWLRQSQNRLGRACIRPEVSRSTTFGAREGASGGQWYTQHLASVRLATEIVQWEAEQQRYLLQPQYDTWFDEVIASAVEVTSPEQLTRGPPQAGKVSGLKYTYKNYREFVHVARVVGLMVDFKDRVPRTAYRGTVSFRCAGGLLCHLVAARPMY